MQPPIPPTKAPRDVTADGPPFKITAKGVWWHGDGIIARPELVKLFASRLVRRADGAYWLETPAEVCHVTVEDVPFYITQTHVLAGAVTFTTSLDETVRLGADHALEMRGGVPYVHIRNHCWGRCSTTVYYALVASALTRGAEIGVESGGQFWALGKADE